MARSPAPFRLASVRRSAVQKLAWEVGSFLRKTPTFSGRGPAYSAQVGPITINTQLQRASNGEAALWACAHSDKGTLNRPPWVAGGATARNVVGQLL